MAQRQLELSCQRFQKELDPEEDKSIKATSLDDVRATIAQTERELASRQGLRNFDRLSPYVNAIERYGKVIETFCNSSPFVPYIWGPLKFIILALKEQTRALDQILGAYAQIGNSLPRLSALQESLKDDHDFQVLFAFLYEDITEFHRRVYKLIRRPAWPIFFSSGWGRFERHFDALISNIEKTSDLIDKQATTCHILEVKEWRQKSLEDSMTLETRRATEQLQAVVTWLGTEVQTQKEKLDWLNSRSHKGTSTWIAKHTKFRSWLQRGRGSPVLWIHGKPGSGKSVLVSQVVSFIPADRKKKVRVLFFFCDYRTPAHQVTTQIFKAYIAQCISQDHSIVPFLYEEYVAKGLSPVAKVLKPALIAVCKSTDMVRLIVDGLDEIEATEHKPVLRELKRLTELCGETCKLLVASQDIPSIRSMLGKVAQIFLGDEREAIEADMRIVVDATLTELDESLQGALDGAQKATLRASILSNAEGMFLWINLILTLLEEACSLDELESIVTTLPEDLEQMYGKLLDRIRSRCDAPRLSRVSRIFEWLLFAEGRDHIQKYDVLLGSSIHKDCMILDRKNIPFPTALDICKPLIEDGPGCTVGLIHSTLPQFLVKSRNGPLLSSRIAQEHIAFACVSHLIQVLQFVQPDLQSEKKTEAVGLGCFGLQRYASENWISHILYYLTEVAQAEISSEVPLIRQLLQLTADHEVLWRKLRPRIHGEDPCIAPPKPLQKLKAFPGIYDLVIRVLSFQDAFSARQLVEGPKVLAVTSDTTLFSLANANYQAAVQRLLQENTSAGLAKANLTEADLIAFKTQFGATAFVCPVKGCARGFSSGSDLEDHKTQRHEPRLKCYQGKCIYNDVGFANAGSLNQHAKKVHKKETPRIPTALKRKKVEGPEPPLNCGSYTTDGHPSDELTPLADLDFNRLSPQHKKIGDDWFVVFNPHIPRLLDLDLVHTLTHESGVCCVSFSMNGRFLATGCNRFAYIYDVVREDAVCVLEVDDVDTGRDVYINALCFSPKDEYLATGSVDKLVRVWHIASRTIKHTFAGHEQDVYALDFSRDGRTLVSGGGDRTVRLWDIESSSSTLTLFMGDSVQTIAISPDSQLIAAGSLGKSIHVWNMQGHLIGRFEDAHGHKNSVYSLAFSPDGKQLLSGSLDRTIKLWELESSEYGKINQPLKGLRCSKTFEGHRDSVLGVAMGSYDDWVLSGSKDRTVQFWDSRTGQTQFMLHGHESSVTAVSMSPTHRYFATASGDKRARIWGYNRLALQ